MTSKLTDGERLVRVEANLDNLTNIVTEMSKDIKSIVVEQNNARMQNVSRSELELELKDIKLSIESSKKKNAFQVFITGSLAALFGSILTLLISYFIQTIGQ